MTLKMKIALFLSLFFGSLLTAGAQAVATPAPAAGTVSTFALTASALALPGNHQTISGAVSGFTISPTANLDLREDNLTPDAPGQLGFFGGFNYHIPTISKAIDNSSNFNGYNFDVYFTASLGMTRITDAASNTKDHYAGLAGFGMKYKLSSGGAWNMGVEARAARIPGMASGWTAVISMGPTLRF